MRSGERQEYCQECRRSTSHMPIGSSGWLVAHSILSVLLCGIWLPVLIVYLLLAKSKYQCQVCGRIDEE